MSHQQLEAENESLREQLTEAHETTAQLTSHMAELQDKWEETSVHLKEAQDEIQSLKETSVHRYIQCIYYSNLQGLRNVAVIS